MRAIDIRDLLNDEVDDHHEVVFKALIDGKEVKFTIPDDVDFTHDFDKETSTIEVKVL